MNELINCEMSQFTI